MRRNTPQTNSGSAAKGAKSLRGKKLFRIFGLALAAPILGVVVVNAILAAPLTGVIYPGVVIANQDVGLKTRAQAIKLLAAKDNQHTLTLKLADKTYVMKSEQLGATSDINTTVDAAYRIGRTTPWPIVGIVSSLKNGRTGYAYSINTATLGKFVSRVLSDVGRPPVNARVQVADGVIAAVPDQDGVSIDQAELGHTLQQVLAEGQDKSVELTPTRVKADIQLPATQPVIDQAKLMTQTNVVLEYQGKTFKPSSVDIASWLTFPAQKSATGESTLVVQVDEAKVRGYVQTIANELNIAPKNKKVTIKNGVSTTDQEGEDGLAINQDSAVTSLLAAVQKQTPNSFTLTTAPVAFKTEYNRITTLDGVARYIEVNLTSQHLWVYQDDQVIYESPITSGATGMGFPTATGLFSIYAKARNTHLIGYQYGPQYNYDVLVDYWMPFYGGFGLHDAWRWRSSYGGPDYYYNGSHGCVNLPLATAAFIYNWADIGTPVWVHT